MSLEVNGTFSLSKKSIFILDSKCAETLNCVWISIDSKFEYEPKIIYFLKVKYNNTLKNYDVIDVVDCPANPFLCFYSLSAYKRYFIKQKIQELDPIKTLFTAYSKKPFLNTKLSIPTFLSKEPSWTIEMYEHFTKEKAPKIIIEAHKIFLKYYEKHYYNGQRYMSTKNISKDILDFFEYYNIFVYLKSYNLLTLKENEIENNFIISYLSSPEVTITVYECMKLDLSLISFYQSMMCFENEKEHLYCTANTTLATYLNSHLGGPKKFCEPISLIKAKENQNIECKILIIDSVNKIGVSNFYCLLQTLKPVHIRLIGNRYERGANVYRGNGGNVFISILNSLHIINIPRIPISDNKVDISFTRFIMTKDFSSFDILSSLPLSIELKSIIFYQNYSQIKKKENNSILLKNFIHIRDFDIYGSLVYAYNHQKKNQLDGGYQLSMNDDYKLKIKISNSEKRCLIEHSKNLHFYTISNEYLLHQYAGGPSDFVYHLIDEKTTLDDILVAQKYALKQYFIVLPGKEFYCKLSGLEFQNKTKFLFY